MKPRAWTPRDDAQLRALYPTTLLNDLAKRFRRSYNSVKNRVHVLGLRRNLMRRAWTPAEDAVIRELYPNTLSATIAKQLGRGLSSLQQHARKLGVPKSREWIAADAREKIMRPDHPGRRHQFPKGHAPANKGLRRPGWNRGRMRETQFTKGQAGWNWKPVGSTRLIDGYQYTKVSDRRHVPWTKNWRPTHILRWEKHRGRVPRGHMVTFRNKNRLDFRLKNLQVLSLRENMLRNTVQNLPKPIRQAIQLLGALKRKINRRKERHEEQNRRSA